MPSNSLAFWALRFVCMGSATPSPKLGGSKRRLAGERRGLWKILVPGPRGSAPVVDGGLGNGTMHPSLTSLTVPRVSRPLFEAPAAAEPWASGCTWGRLSCSPRGAHREPECGRQGSREGGCRSHPCEEQL